MTRRPSKDTQPSAEEVLRTCLSSQTEMLLSRSGLRGRVTRLLERHIWVQCEVIRRALPQAESMVCVEFNHGSRSGAFFARVVEWEEDVLVLDRPQQVLYVDVRQSFRVPTDALRGLRADLDGVDAQILDVSRQGLRVALEKSALERGTETTLTATWEDDFAVVVVRAVAVREYEVCFLLTDPPDTWIRLVNKVEREWMRRNRG